ILPGLDHGSRWTCCATRRWTAASRSSKSSTPARSSPGCSAGGWRSSPVSWRARQGPPPVGVVLVAELGEQITGLLLHGPSIGAGHVIAPALCAARAPEAAGPDVLG